MTRAARIPSIYMRRRASAELLIAGVIHVVRVNDDASAACSVDAAIPLTLTLEHRDNHERGIAIACFLRRYEGAYACLP